MKPTHEQIAKRRSKRPKQPAPEIIPDSALAWPTEPEPQPVDVRQELEGKPYGSLYVGWSFNAYRATDSLGSVFGAVEQGCSSGYSHSTRCTTHTTTQNGGRFYATKADAILAMRWEVCRRFAKVLHNISKIPTDEPSKP